jgi:hypothetical protein
VLYFGAIAGVLVMNKISLIERWLKITAMAGALVQCAGH